MAESCPLAFYWKYVLGLPEADRENFFLGRVAHDGLAQYIRSCHQRDVEHWPEKRREIAGAFSGYPWAHRCIMAVSQCYPRGNHTSLEGVTNCHVEQVMPFPALGPPPPGADPEHPGVLRANLPDGLGTFYGRPDVIYEYERQGLVIIPDWKTRHGTPPAYDPRSPTPQSIAYAWLAFQQFPWCKMVLFREITLPWPERIFVADIADAWSGDWGEDEEEPEQSEFREWRFERKDVDDEMIFGRVRAIAKLKPPDPQVEEDKYGDFRPRTSAFCTEMCGYALRCPLINELGPDAPITSQEQAEHDLLGAIQARAAANAMSKRLQAWVKGNGHVIVTGERGDAAAFYPRVVEWRILDGEKWLIVNGLALPDPLEVDPDLGKRVKYSASELGKLMERDEVFATRLMVACLEKGIPEDEVIERAARTGKWSMKGLRAGQGEEIEKDLEKTDDVLREERKANVAEGELFDESGEFKLPMPMM